MLQPNTWFSISNFKYLWFVFKNYNIGRYTCQFAISNQYFYAQMTSNFVSQFTLKQGFMWNKKIIIITNYYKLMKFKVFFSMPYAD